MTQDPQEVVVDYLADGMYGVLEPIPWSDNASVVYESESVNEILQWCAVTYGNETNISVSDMAKMASSNETTELISKIDEYIETQDSVMKELEKNVSSALEEFLNAIMNELNKDDNDDPQRNDDSD